MMQRFFKGAIERSRVMMIDLAASGVWWNARRGGGVRAREGVGVMRA